jgi:hypothetical protein
VNDQYQSRREYFAEHGRWPDKGRRSTERYTVTFTPAAPPSPARPAAPPPAPFKSPERLAWEAAYAGAEVGPQGGSWPEDGTGYSRYMVWKLAFHELTRTPPPRLHPAHRT